MPEHDVYNMLITAVNQLHDSTFFSFNLDLIKIDNDELYILHNNGQWFKVSVQETDETY